MIKKVLITGGTGYLGRNLLALLCQRELEVYALVRPESDRALLPSQVKCILEKEISSLPKIDFFIHVATTYGRKGESEEVIFKTNKELPLSIAKKIFHEKLILINTDTSLPKGFSSYATSKKEFVEILVKKYSNLKIMNMICEQFYGPKDGTFVSFVADNLKAEKEVELTDGLQKRDFINVDDVVSAFMLTIDLAEELPKGLNNFEVGSGNALTIKEIAELICSILGKEQSLLKWGARPKRAGEIMLSVADITKLQELGWRPKVALETGLRAALEER